MGVLLYVLLCAPKSGGLVRGLKGHERPEGPWSPLRGQMAGLFKYFLYVFF